MPVLGNQGSTTQQRPEDKITSLCRVFQAKYQVQNSQNEHQDQGRLTHSIYRIGFVDKLYDELTRVLEPTL